MHDSPDYSSYSLEQLLDAQTHVNRELYSERAAEIDRWVALRTSERSASRVASAALPVAIPGDSARPLLVACAVTVVLALTIVGVIVLFVVRGNKADESSRKVAVDVVSAVTRRWDPEDLRKNASEEFKPIASGANMERVFKMFRQLGNVITLGEPTGGSRATAGIGSVRSGITAEYSFPAKFTNGDATIRVRLIREGGHWKTTGFFINSDVFLPK